MALSVIQETSWHLQHPTAGVTICTPWWPTAATVQKRGEPRPGVLLMYDAATSLRVLTSMLALKAHTDAFSQYLHTSLHLVVFANHGSLCQYSLCSPQANHLKRSTVCTRSVGGFISVIPKSKSHLCISRVQQGQNGYRDTVSCDPVFESTTRPPNKCSK